MSGRYVMGLDGGTGGYRAGIYDLDGNRLVFAESKYPTDFPHPGWAEQNPADWWRAMGESSRKALALSGLKKEDIGAICYTGTCGSLVLSKKDGAPVCPSLIWMDVRATEEAKTISATKHPCMKVHCYANVSSEWVPCKALWLKRHRRELYDGAEVFCEFVDWITFKLTGSWTANMSSLASRWYYDARDGGFPKDLYEAVGLGDMLPRVPGTVTYVGDNLGTLTPAAAEHLGLSTDTIVAQGGLDASLGMIGLGVIKPGRISLVTGSSHLILGFSDSYTYGREGVFGPFADAIIPGLGLVEGGQVSTGSILNWFVKNFCGDMGENAYDELNREAEKLPIGADGLMVLDWWQGNRTPYTDSNIRGNIYGLSLNHTRAHLFRAIMEGVAFGTENVFRSFRKAGFPVEEIYISGGATNSPLWLQIQADVSGVVIHVPDNVEAPSLGAAILATKAAGYYTLEQAVEKMVRYDRDIVPDSKRRRQYEILFERYQAAYGECGKWMGETSAAFKSAETAQ